MKKIFLGLVFLLAALTAFAIPAKRGQKTTLTLADGTQVVAELRGDEFGHYYEAADGRVFVKSANTDVYEQADKTEITNRANIRRTARNAKRAERRNVRHNER